MSEGETLAREEARREGEVFAYTIAAGVVGLGVLILFYMYTPFSQWLRSGDAPAPLAPETLSAPNQASAAGAYVVLGPIDLDFRQAGVRFLDAPSFTDASYAAYVPVRDAVGRVSLVVRMVGYRDLRDMPRERLPAQRVTGILVRGAPGLLARVDNWPGNPLRGEKLSEVWILLQGQRPPRLGDIAPGAAVGLALVLLPLLGVAVYWRRRRLSER